MVCGACMQPISKCESYSGPGNSRYTEYDEYEEASEAAEAIEEAFQVAEEAAQTSDLADRYLALSQAEEIASEHSLMHLLPDHREFHSMASSLMDASTPLIHS